MKYSEVKRHVVFNLSPNVSGRIHNNNLRKTVKTHIHTEKKVKDAVGKM